MSDRSTIEWTDATWNPVTGCTEVSPGCDHCYAKTFAERWRDTPGHYFQHGFDVQLRPDKLDQPLRWRKPRRIFVNSMSDLFHDAIPDDYLEQVFATMAAAQQHTFQILTKRHARMRSFLRRASARVDQGQRPFKHPYISGKTWPLRNVWLGVSAENQQWADIRIPALLDTPAAVRFLSAEPLLGPIELKQWYISTADRSTYPVLDWLIVGGESGRGARPMDPQWARQLRDDCQAANVAFLFKQWGEWAPTGSFAVGQLDAAQSYGSAASQDWPHGFTGHEVLQRFGKKTAGRNLDGRIWDQYPKKVSDAYSHNQT